MGQESGWFFGRRVAALVALVVGIPKRIKQGVFLQPEINS